MSDGGDMALARQTEQHWHRSAMIGVIALSALALGLAAPATAQNAPTREEILRTPLGDTAAAANLEIDAEDGIERAPCPLANPEFANTRFVLRDVQFSGAEPIERATLDASWRALAGTEVPVAAICEIRDRAATQLRRDGYLAAVRVPVQTIADGVVRLDILAAHLSAIRVRGNAGASERQLARYLAKIEGQPLFNIHEAERYLLLANSLPGTSARLTLRPGSTPGDVIGEVTVERTPIMLDANIQNFGGRAVGREGGIVRARLGGITGLGDETTLAIYSTANVDEQQVVQGGHEFRLGSEGVTVGTSLTYAWTRPTITAGLNIDTRTLVWTSQVRTPTLLRQSRSIWLGAGFDWIDQDVFALGTLLSRDHLRVAWLNMDGAWTDPDAFSARGGYSPAEPRWSIALNVQLRQGLGLLDASNPCGAGGAGCFGAGGTPISRIEADTTATVLRAEGEMVWRPTPTIAFALSPRGQYAHRPLLSYEEFSAGNYTAGRGYDPGILTGDSGVGFGVEARIGSLVPQTRRALALQPFVFFDAAWVWNKDTAFAGISPQHITSAGGGVRLAWGDRARIDVTVAEPLRRVGIPPARAATRVLISFTTQLGIGH
ncbi:MAG: ShlB/FhaC/HecB family hemolysin secretion/activation protein [Sphingopyxis sp.]